MKKTKDQKLLIISYYLPPIKTVAGVRLKNFHRESQKKFREIHSLTTTNRHLFPKENIGFDDSKTIEVSTWDLRRLINIKNNTSANINQSIKEKKITQFISKLSYSFPFNLLLADGAITYILGGFFKGKRLIQQEKIKVLFSSYKPYSDHLICFLLKKWNPKLVWIADFRDLHVDETRNNILFPNIQKWFNRRILKKANIVTTVSKGLANKLKDFHSNVYVLRNGISKLNTQNTKQEFYKKFTISYTGSIYPNHQSASPLLHSIQELISEKKIDQNHIQLIYAGKEGGVWNDWIETSNLQKINTTNRVLSKSEAQIIQLQSHINLLLSWSSVNQKGILTGKFYEYLAAKNPILLLINGVKDEEFETIFNNLQAGLVVYNNDRASIKRFILEHYEEWLEKGKITPTIAEEKLHTFTWEHQMNEFIEHLEKNIIFDGIK